MYEITNTESTDRIVYGERISPGESKRVAIGDEQADELSDVHFDIEEVGDETDADEQDEREASHECDACGRSFESERGLKTHARQSHEGDD